MADVGDIANYAEILGALLVVGGLGFAVLELRRNREQKRRDAAYEIVNNMGSKEFLTSLRLLYAMPDDLSKKELEEQYADHMDDLMWVFYLFENLGTLVARHVVPIDLAEDFLQVSIINAWKKLRPYIEELREQTGKPHLYIYMQWLAETVEARGRDIGNIEAELAKWRPS